MKDLTTRLSRKIRRFHARHARSGSKALSSRPFISGDTFKSLADHSYDGTGSFDPKKVKEGDIVFIKTDLVHGFFEKMHPSIDASYRIITHNSDRRVGEKEAGLIDGKVIRWYAQNAAVSHPKLTPIPIGLENMSYFENGIVGIFEGLRRKAVPKKNRILSAFSVGTNPQERGEALAALRRSPVADILPDRPEPSEYLSTLQSYKFVAAPEGNGPDSHRIWEAAALGAIPIAKKTRLLEHFHSLGLPILFIDDWKDVEAFSEQQLEALYSKIMLTCGPVADNLVMFHYWQGIVRAPEDKRDEFLVCVAIGHKFRQSYERDFKESHERFAYDLRRPLVVIGDFIQKVDKRPTWQKLVMFKTPILAKVDRVMLLDADIYVKDTGESPLDFVPEGQWGLAPNNAFDLPTLAVTDLTLYAQCPPENRPSFVMNCGFFIVSQKAHRKVMEYVFESYGEQICDEQGPFNYHLINEYKGVVLPFRFNNIVGSYMEKYGYSMTTVMNMYAQTNSFHFAGRANRKIFRIIRLFREHPAFYSIAAFPPVLAVLDAASKLVKEAKGI